MINPKPILLLFLSEAPWQYYIQFEQYLHQLQHPFKEHVHVIRDVKLRFPEAILKQYKVIAFFYHDPLAELYPEQYAYAKKLEAFCQQHQIRLINRPEPLSLSNKSSQLNLLSQHGFKVAKTYAIESMDDIKRIPPNDFPIFIRYDVGHDSQGGHIQGPYTSSEEAEGLCNLAIFAPGQRLKTPVALQWIDTISNDGLYRKYRVYATPKQVLKAFIAISPDWYVHWDNTLQNDMMFKEDQAYIESAVSRAEYELFTRVVQVLDLDFCGIDYAFTSSGQIVVWEVNPHPSLDGTEEPIRSRFTQLLVDYYTGIMNEVA
ncbi:MAG: hypothetical protein FGM54_08125 [Chitinophagaceae bacterium]|nr:hypothetical protein [Chitinophagaceae bacterium]